MFKRKLLGAAALVAAATLASGTASAAPYLYPTGATPTDDNYVQELEDGFWETLLTFDRTTQTYVLKPITADTVIEVGDIFAGVQRIQATELSDPSGDDAINLGSVPTFTAIFLTQVVTSTSNGDIGTIDGSTDVQTFGAASTAAWEGIFGAGGLLDLTSTGFNVADLDSVAPGAQQVSTGTVAMLFNGTLYGPAAAGGTDPTAATLSTSASTFVNNGVLQYEFGFTDAAGEFWKTNGTDSALPGLSGVTKPTVNLALNITKQWAGPNLEQHIYAQGALGDPINFTAPTHLQGVGAVAGLAGGTPWGVRGDVDLFIRPVPEPASLALISAGLLGLGFSARRKKSA